ncbi:hypothetical protein BLA29_006481, partial [Euroglyphus maynei]
MPTSVRIVVYHLFLMASLSITLIDSLILFINVWNNGSGLPSSASTATSSNSTTTTPTSSLIFDNEPIRSISYCIIILLRLSFAIIMLTYGYKYPLRYQDRFHLFIHSIYFLWICIILFLLGSIITYQQFVWSLVIQIIHLYISLIYTFKAFLYHYDDSIDGNMDFGRRPADLDEETSNKNNESTGSRSLDRATKRSRYGKVLYFVNKNLLAISTLMMIILSVFVAILLRNTLIPGTPWTQRRLLRLSFVGEIFIRVLLSLIVPLIGTSIAYACTGFDPESSGRIMSEVIVYYL